MRQELAYRTHAAGRVRPYKRQMRHMRKQGRHLSNKSLCLVISYHTCSAMPASVPQRADQDAFDESLPDDWQAWPWPMSTQQIGTFWHQQQRSVALQVPLSRSAHTAQYASEHSASRFRHALHQRPRTLFGGYTPYGFILTCLLHLSLANRS